MADRKKETSKAIAESVEFANLGTPGAAIKGAKPPKIVVGADGKFPLAPVPNAIKDLTGSTPAELNASRKVSDAAFESRQNRIQLEKIGTPERAPRPDRSRLADANAPTPRKPGVHGVLSSAQRMVIETNQAKTAKKPRPDRKPKLFAAPDVSPAYGDPHKKSGKKK